jgi:DNA repair protein RecO (recombination protein O)
MTKPRSYQTPAIIIKKTKLGEADRILTLYTPELGKIQGVAKAVRRPKSKLSGHLELLTYSQVTLARGKNIDTIIGSQTINTFLSIKNDLDMISDACYVIEMVQQFTAEESADPWIFELLLNTLERLSLSHQRSLLLRYFELHLLKQCGYHPELEKCVLCRKPLEAAANTFSPSAGGVMCPSCQRQSPHYGYPLSPNCLKAMQMIQAKDWTSLDATQFEADALDELEKVMRRYVRYLLEKEIKSAAWLDCLRCVPLLSPQDKI